MASIPELRVQVVSPVEMEAVVIASCTLATTMFEHECELKHTHQRGCHSAYNRVLVHCVWPWDESTP